MLGELSRTGFPHHSISLFLAMIRDSNEASADVFNVPVLLRSCAAAEAVGTGISSHGFCLKSGLGRNMFVGSALVFMYVKFGMVDEARVVFDEMPERDMVLWTSMLSGYAQSDKPELAIGILKGMGNAGLELDGVVMVSLLLACGRAGWVRLGKSVHGRSLRMCLKIGLCLGNALVDMYVKCAALDYADRVFERMRLKDVISWSTLILGHGLNGNAEFALELFARMTVRPNSVTYLGVLSACAHAGLVDNAWQYWTLMKRDAGLKHYACMVDVLGRAGRFAEAENFIADMPMEPDEVVWAALLSGCRVHGNSEVGERASKRLMTLRPEKSGYYALLANICTDSGRFQDAQKIRDVMKNMNVGKAPGFSNVL